MGATPPPPRSDQNNIEAGDEEAVEPAGARPAVQWEAHGGASARSSESQLSGRGARPQDVAATPLAPASDGWSPRWGSTHFWASFAMLCTLTGVIELGIVPLAAYVHRERMFAAELLVAAATLVVTVYLLEWASLYGNCLHTARRAYFDEPNVRKTYQPRAKTMGHLFQPEPPTPGPSDEQRASAEADWLAHTTAADAADYERAKQHGGARAAFNAARDMHYRDEFQTAMRAAKQMHLDEPPADDSGGGGKPQTGKGQTGGGVTPTAEGAAAGRRRHSDRKKAPRRSKKGSRSRSDSRGRKQ